MWLWHIGQDTTSSDNTILVSTTAFNNTFYIVKMCDMWNKNSLGGCKKVYYQAK